ncbi:MAG: septum formation protein Maf [Nitrospirae bacterium GWC2_42_7]|nr:MAG: septum formation protein Maf [Nitrospirae bacterium GWC2_42_7]
MKKIILASASPRRKEILMKTGLKFKVDASEYAEDNGHKLSPQKLAIYLSSEKAKSVAIKYKNAIIISADTFIVFKNRIFGKPRNISNAREMLKLFSGKPHSVITGFTIIDTSENKRVSKTVETKVFFRKLNDKEIESYLRTKESLGKAGAYGIQGMGAMLINKIEGDYYNVMGLPLTALVENLKKFGIEVL